MAKALLGTDSIDNLRHEIDRLENYIGDVEDERDDARDRLKKAEKACAGTRLLAEAVRMYFSWAECPPPGMDAAAYEALRANFRADVEMALRAVEG